MRSATTSRAISATVLTLFMVGCGGENLPPSVNAHLEAVQAAERGDHKTAVRILTKVLQQHEDARTYFDRARSHLELGQTSAAIRDCDAGLHLEPDNADLLWLKAEAAKPEETRFQGPNALAPSSNR